MGGERGVYRVLFLEDICLCGGLLTNSKCRDNKQGKN